MSGIRIVVVNDNALARGGIEAIIAGRPDLEVVGSAPTLQQAQRIGRQEQPDLFVVSIPVVMPEIVEMLTQLSATSGPKIVPALVLTPGPGRLELDLLRIHASVISNRNISAQQLVAAIRLVAAGYMPVACELSARLAGAWRGRQASHDVEAHEADELTSRQREVLGLIACGLSNAEIAEALAVAESTVKSHVKGILGKLGVRSRLEAAIYANGPVPAAGPFASD